jgi:hypothetical protein
MDATLTAFLSAYSPDMQAIALKMRTLILDALPDMIEQLDVSARIIGYGYDRTYKGMVCAIAPQTSSVNFMFSKGNLLPDPDGLLEGTGKLARHIKMRTLADLERPGVQTLLLSAATLTRDGMHSSNKK